MDIFDVNISKDAEKDLRRLPEHIVFKLGAWIDGVKAYGLRAIRIMPGFYDEPLKGSRKGQRSIRLNKVYRAIYSVVDDKKPNFINILEVTKHEY